MSHSSAESPARFSATWSETESSMILDMLSVVSLPSRMALRSSYIALRCRFMTSSYSSTDFLAAKCIDSTWRCALSMDLDTMDAWMGMSSSRPVFCIMLEMLSMRLPPNRRMRSSSSER